jgi:hypothetical protein
MSELTSNTVYFKEAGKMNTARTLELALDRARALHLRQVLVASTNGDTGAMAAPMFKEFELIVVSHSAGFRAPNTQELTDANRSAILEAGAKILTCQHAFSGVARAVRKKMNTYQLEDYIAFTLRMFGQGMKVAAEMALMAADSGILRVGEPTLCVAGTVYGADTAVILSPVNSDNFFELQFLEIICLPAPGHPLFSRR